MFACLLLLSGCARCGCGDDEEIVASLLQASGTVERDQAESVEQWVGAASGATFSSGDGLRTGADGAARIQLSRGGTLRMGNDSFIRFLVGQVADETQRLQLDVGDVEIETGETAVDVQTPSSRVRVERGSKLAVDYGESGRARFEVTVGRARYFPGAEAGDGEEGEGEVVEQGQALLVDRASGRIEERVAASSPRAPEPIPDDRGSDAGVGEQDDAGDDAASLRVRVTGDNAQVRGPDDGDWRPLGAGDVDVEVGARLRLGGGTTVDLRRGDGRATLIGAAEASLGGADGPILRLASGQATAESGGGTVSLAVPGGMIVLRPNARSSVAIGEEGAANVRAVRGQVEVRGGRRPVLLEAGGVATLERGGDAEVETAPSRATMSLSAGSSGIIHDPRPPTNLAIRFGDACPSGGAVEISRGEDDDASRTVEGDGSVIVRLNTGAYQYQVYCVVAGERRGDPVSSGRVRILRDPGTSPMGVPGHNNVDADGRNYTVHFETTPPGITFRWTRAPQAESFDFHLRSSARTITRSVPRPRFTMRSGVLGAGTYTFFFTSSAGHRSPQTRVTLRVDTAATIASVRSPGDGTASPGSRVHVSGIARPGSSVSVGGASIPFESSTRFGGEAVAPSDDEAIAIRVAHPTAGVHYFLRRMGGGSD